QFFQGIVLVNQHVNEVLAGMGVAPIASIGERFDPHFHEAVAVEESDVYPPQTVSAEFLRGYRLGERVIRPSMVKVTAVKTRADNSTRQADDFGDFFLETD
ncbi:MAG TPA: nucleotide exchange factor GrpE, partial [Pyrinomonadaceae bacterium]